MRWAALENHRRLDSSTLHPRHRIHHCGSCHSSRRRISWSPRLHEHPAKASRGGFLPRPVPNKINQAESSNNYANITNNFKRIRKMKIQDEYETSGICPAQHVNHTLWRKRWSCGCKYFCTYSSTTSTRGRSVMSAITKQQNAPDRCFPCLQ